MKKLIVTALVLTFIFTLAACSAEKSTVSNGEIDLDLTKLGSTMVYSEVYNMIYEPSKYIGKTVKMQGTFTVAYGDEPDSFYPAVLIADATACCSQGMEFVLKGEPAYPDAYPQRGVEVTVVGVFDTYLENGQLFCHLKNAEIVK